MSKMINIKQFGNIPPAPESSSWKNKTYDKDHPYSPSNRTKPTIIEGFSHAEHESSTDIKNRPLQQITDNTLINKNISDETLKKMFEGQDGVLEGFDFTGVDSSNVLVFSRGIYLLNYKYIDFINYVDKGQTTVRTDDLELELESPEPNTLYYIQFDDEGEYFFNTSLNESMILIGTILTESGGLFDEASYVNLVSSAYLETHQHIYNETLELVSGSVTRLETLNSFKLGTTSVYLNGIKQILNTDYSELDNQTIEFSELTIDDLDEVTINYLRSFEE